MPLKNITLISFGYFEKDLLESVAEVVKLEFRTSAMVREGHIDLSDYYDPGRRQYNGNTLLKHVDSLILPVTGKMLGLFNVDLFIPILTYIFGQAFLGGPHRYRIPLPAEQRVLRSQPRSSPHGRKV